MIRKREEEISGALVASLSTTGEWSVRIYLTTQQVTNRGCFARGRHLSSFLLFEQKTGDGRLEVSYQVRSNGRTYRAAHCSTS